MKLNSRWNLVISVLKLFAKLKKGIYLTATFFVVLVYSYGYIQFSSVQSLSRVWFFVTPWIAAHQASLSMTNSRSSPKLMSIESVMPSSRLILCRPLLLLPPIPPSIRVFSNESTLCMRWPKYWSFSFNISPSNEHPGLISFRMDWLDLLAVQGTQESSPTPQFKSINSSALSFLHSPTLTSIHGKTIALTRRTFVGKVMSLLFNMLSSFSSKGQAPFDFMAAITICTDFGTQEKKVYHCFHGFPIYFPWSDGNRYHDLSHLNVEF